MFKFIGNTSLVKRFFGPMTLPTDAPKAQVSAINSVSEGYTGLVNTIQESNIPGDAKEYAISQLLASKTTVEGVLAHGWEGAGKNY